MSSETKQVAAANVGVKLVDASGFGEATPLQAATVDDKKSVSILIKRASECKPIDAAGKAFLERKGVWTKYHAELQYIIVDVIAPGTHLEPHSSDQGLSAKGALIIITLISAEEGVLFLPRLSDDGKESKQEGQDPLIGVRSIRGEPRSCHDNVDNLVKQGLAAHIYCGYALSDDGRWRYHSWASDSTGCLIETTEPRLAYLGFKIIKKGVVPDP